MSAHRTLLALCAFVCAGQALAQSPASASIDVPEGAHLVLSAHGEGSQVYTCVDGHWTLKAPDAKLLDAHGTQIGTHFAGPTWKLTDGSEVKGKAVGSQASPDADSVPWLLLEAVPGSGSGQLATVAWIRRTETKGGKAPTAACSSGTMPISYSANYSFYSR
ncbi:DUF3455 domain-containing protein [Silvibacterium sp.]|uniref:DUF3455 domain-containing protein n=1 Tax=Silvibacterium sp. TaxID=1964179 RepID=UPI0039E4CF02